MTINKQALRQLATDAHELGIIKRYTKGIEANKRFAATATPLTVLALLDELEALQSFRTAFNEWHDKTEWVQGDNRFDVIKPWGKHRADVLKLYIEHLEAKLQTADKLQDSAFRHGLQHGFSLGQTDNQAGFEECLSAYGSRGKDNG
ncbi:TPA: ead/Ea22-like family protein [Citrobacter freundii]|nr:ead/Ea22-like family protein [Citrobacter freundii]